MPNGMSERSVLIEHCGVGGSVRKDTLYPIRPLISFRNCERFCVTLRPPVFIQKRIAIGET